jgi:hypothetical protein
MLNVYVLDDTNGSYIWICGNHQMLSVFESNVANGIGSMEIYNLKVQCTSSYNVF